MNDQDLVILGSDGFVYVLDNITEQFGALWADLYPEDVVMLVEEDECESAGTS